MAAVRPAARAARPAEWICYALGGLPGAALAVLAALGLVSSSVAVALFAVSFVGLNLIHNAATWSRVYLDPDGVRGAVLERVVVPATLIAGALVAEASGGAVLLLGLQYYLSIHHGAMQSYGILRSRQRRVGREPSRVEARLCQAACVLGPIGALLWRARAVCGQYDGVPLAAPPLWLVGGVGGAGLLALVGFLGAEWRAHRRGERVEPLGIAIVLGTSVIWSALLITIAHPALPLYALASGHYLQYLYFVWRAEAARPSLRRVPARLRERIAPPARLPYLAALGLLGGGVAVLLTLVVVALRHAALLVGAAPGPHLIPPWTAAMIGVNLAHYWLDRRIWRAPSVAGARSPSTSPERAEPLVLARG